MTLISHPQYFSATLDRFESINRALLAGFLNHQNNEDIKRSHFFEGRYENVYITKDLIPELEIILNTVIEHAAEILQQDKTQLKAGLWFNAMQPGNLTLAHRHDDDDELLSAVYYIAVADNSGQLILHDKNFTTHVQAREGMFVFFPPNISHEVSINNSHEIRLSVGINIGPKHSQT